MRSGARAILARFAPRGAAVAAAWFVLLAVIFTWPVAARAGRVVPGDHGDPLLNCWILAWNADHLLRAIGGEISALGRIWHGNIFHPEAYTLGYSELLFAQTVQILPVYAATGNILLCYNLLLISSYALSGLGMFLLVRQLTGNWRAAFVAGLIYGFLPYRVDQVPHIQTQSSQWMPFVLYGLRRYFDHGGAWPLAGAAVAFVAQNLSCGYLLIYFSLFVPLCVLYEMVTRGRVRDARTWLALGATAAAVGIGTVPFMHPYLALRGLGLERDINEAATYAADLYAYLTAPYALNLWGGGRLQLFERAEGALFMGFTAMALAAGGAAMGVRQAFGTILAATRAARSAARGSNGLSAVARRTLVVVALAGLALSAGALALYAATGGGRYRILGHVLRMSSLDRPVAGLIGFLVLLWCASPSARAAARAARADPGRVMPAPLFWSVCAVLAWWMSLGPRITLAGRPTGSLAIYGFFFEHVPGVDGLRVPARMAMVLGCFLAILAGYGAAALTGRRAPTGTVHLGRGWPAVVTAVVGCLVLVESVALPYPTDGPAYAAGGLRHPDTVVYAADEAPAVYRHLAEAPRGSVVLLEFPFGDHSWDLRHVYYSTVHWHPLLNGYSGFFPPSFMRRVAVWGRPLATPEAAWRAVVESGATHVVVHGRAYAGSEQPAPDAWLVSHGARPAGTFGVDRLYEVGAAQEQEPRRLEEEEVRPGADGRGEIHHDKDGNDAVDRHEVQERPEGQRHRLRRGKGGSLAHRPHEPGDQRIGFDGAPEGLDANVREGAIEHLAGDVRQDDHVAERAARHRGFSA
jgi:hypothetical protein